MRVIAGCVPWGVTAAMLLAGAGAAQPTAQAERPQPGSAPVIWSIDSLVTIGGQHVTIAGSPRVVETPEGKAIEFNGASDGVFVENNPLAGLDRFTIEVVFSPAADGSEEQRFVHIEETGTGNRALIELRMLPGAAWCLDSFLRHGDASLTLIDRAKIHPSASWHVAALSFDGQTMAHYVDRVRQGSGGVAFKPLGPGRTSIGVRQNLVSWFKGRVRLMRITPAVVPTADLLRVSM
jgi:hypothetical protein